MSKLYAALAWLVFLLAGFIPDSAYKEGSSPQVGAAGLIAGAAFLMAFAIYIKLHESDKHLE